jgi:hypothetical protein
MDRSQMLTGQTTTMQCIQINNTNLKGMVPSNMDGPAAPPAGSPNYFLMEGPKHSNAIYLYRFHVDFTNPANTNLIGPIKISVAPYTASQQVSQYGTTQLLHSNGGFLLTPLQYRNSATAATPYESLVVAHSVLTGTASSRSVGMRWYELRNPGSIPVVYQQGTYAPDSAYRWMGSIAMDGMGDIAMGYSISETTAYPAVRYTGRVPTDPLGAMEMEATIFEGSGNQSDSDRWGDYTSMSVDPVDDCTMWYTGQYLAAVGSNNWATRLFSFQFPACQRATAHRLSSHDGSAAIADAAVSASHRQAFRESRPADPPITQSVEEDYGLALWRAVSNACAWQRVGTRERAGGDIYDDDVFVAALLCRGGHHLPPRELDLVLLARIWKASEVLRRSS